jgi:hypothetical protein
VNAATITNAKYFGVVNYRGKVDVMNSTISKIGNKPFDGTQHGVGIFFTTEKDPSGETLGSASGTIKSNSVSQYQKGGITVRGAGATAKIWANTVTGLGPVNFIAQNGIQVSFGANATLLRNTVTGHDYTPADTESCGVLFYHATGDTTASTDTLSHNEQNLCVVKLDGPGGSGPGGSGPGGGGVTCTPTGFFRDGINLTAAKMGGTVSGKIDAAGCDIGVYYGPGSTGLVNAATITNARYFGVVNYRGKVDVMNSTISKIGNVPFDGTQHGVGIFFTTEKDPSGETLGSASGTIKSNSVSQYQKGGITVRGKGATAKIWANTVIGRGLLYDIAQNGIQVSFGAGATLLRNTVGGHSYAPAGTEACGVLFYGAIGDTSAATDTLFGNQQDRCVVNLT